MVPRQSSTHRTQALATFFVIFSVVAAQSQQETSHQQHTGSVIGQVICDDTRAPARFAEVRLILKPSEASLANTDDQPPPEPAKPQLRRAAGVTEIDGAFRIDNVPAGDYFAAAIEPGYLTPSAGVDETTSADKLKSILASIPTIHVAEGQVNTINLSVHRGGVITGRVQYADGSPAIESKVSWQASNYDIDRARLAPRSLLRDTLREFDYYPIKGRNAETDDHGRYRIYGLPSGKYIISTVVSTKLGAGDVQLSNGASAVNHDNSRRIYPNMTAIYAPGVLRRSDAKAFDVRADEEVTDADLKIDLTGLHAIKGSVLAGEDHHVPRQAMFQIFENGKRLERMSTLDDDGSFEIDYIPSGAYTLTIFGSSDEFPPANPGAPPQTRRYQTLRLDVIVGEHDVILGNLLLSPLKPGEKQDWP